MSCEITDGLNKLRIFVVRVGIVKRVCSKWWCGSALLLYILELVIVNDKLSETTIVIQNAQWISANETKEKKMDILLQS